MGADADGVFAVADRRAELAGRRLIRSSIRISAPRLVTAAVLIGGSEKTRAVVRSTGFR
jgi:hypothetical protein